MKQWFETLEKSAKCPLPLPKSESERACEAERKNRRRLERELKKLGWESIEDFEADAEEMGHLADGPSANLGERGKETKDDGPEKA